MTSELSKIQLLFLDALRAALRGARVTWEEPLSNEEWAALFKLAGEQQVLPMIYEAAARCPAAQTAPADVFAGAKGETLRTAVYHAMKARRFWPLLDFLSLRGIRPVIVKGVVCRYLYPHPDLRRSVDEDLLILPEEEEAAVKALEDFGMADNGAAPPGAADRQFCDKNGELNIELHKALFPPDFEARHGMDRIFGGAYGRALEREIDGHRIRTLEETDHFLYLAAHAFKHFLIFGFGLRQLCDILLFAEHCGSVICWDEVAEKSRKVRMDRFLAALLKIGEEHLGFDMEKAQVPDGLRGAGMDELPLLLDLLSAGVYGKSSMSRWHSSAMTASVLNAQGTGKKRRSGLLRSIFPSFSYMSEDYPFLRKAPFLLPFAWCIRIFRYARETLQSRKSGVRNNAAESVKIGRERIRLMRMYGIID